MATEDSEKLSRDELLEKRRLDAVQKLYQPKRDLCKYELRELNSNLYVNDPSRIRFNPVNTKIFGSSYSDDCTDHEPLLRTFFLIHNLKRDYRHAVNIHTAYHIKIREIRHLAAEVDLRDENFYKRVRKGTRYGGTVSNSVSEWMTVLRYHLRKDSRHTFLFLIGPDAEGEDTLNYIMTLIRACSAIADTENVRSRYPDPFRLFLAYENLSVHNAVKIKLDDCPLPSTYVQNNGQKTFQVLLVDDDEIYSKRDRLLRCRAEMEIPGARKAWIKALGLSM